jgi:DNA polymerase elongation subunit (family B)
MAIKCKLIDFSVNTRDAFVIQMFGINTIRETFSITINNFTPFIYIKVGSKWTSQTCDDFIEHLKKQPTLWDQSNNIFSYELIKRKSLYGFDGGKYYNFIYISCKNMNFIYKIKALYYDKDTQQLNDGYMFGSTNTTIYETMIPPLLRFFHIQNISPSGWITIDNYRIVKKKSTTCKYELTCSYKDIISIDDDTPVPYKICSFDIEANSSHGDFPEAIKNYKKVAYDIVNYISKHEIDKNDIPELFKELLLNVFDFKNTIDIDNCFTKHKYSEVDFINDYTNVIKSKLNNNAVVKSKLTKYFKNKDEDECDIPISKVDCSDIITLLSSNTSLPIQTLYLIDLLDINFPELKGDEVTFIGSSFINYGEESPYLQHCICIANTANVKEGQVINCYDSEKDILCAWTKLIQKEDPDIIIGYNIFGFDYKFMYERAKENDCVTEFMNLGRTHLIPTELQTQSIVLASGPYDLLWIPMEGRLQIDLYTYMRKDYALPSYKLDYVASTILNDSVKKYLNVDNTCMIYTKNVKGIELNNFVHFEVINHSTEIYNDGEKFKVIGLHDEGFIIQGNIHCDEKINWGLAKDDISPKEIFEMSLQGPNEKGIIAKYCIQDCTLVHQLFQKIDVMTTFIEMSKLCSVPISFLVTRGQGIKLTSYMAKKCREKDVLMPLISKGDEFEAYEGAIVLEPKCNLYLDMPVACVDYSSLYPSVSISENFSMDSKVGTIEYNVDGTIKKKNGVEKITGYRNEDGSFKYGNLEGYTYVKKQFETFHTEGNNKIIDGYKITTWAQYPNNQKAILPSILQELLAARKSTRKQMGKETDPFKKNILDKRQLSIKVTANSLYGQAGSKTSSFYDIDVAAAITATGRIMIQYAKEVIENVYNNLDVETPYGVMRTNAEYIYGDTDSVFFTFNLTQNGEKVVSYKALDVTITLAKEAGKIATMFLKEPHDLEYEKTYMPFCLLSKKRYVGMLYEDDPNVGKRKSMGIVLNRRDNAPIVKDIYGGIIDILMKDKDIEKAIQFLKTMLEKLTNQQVPIEKLIITKSLRSFYKKPNQIAHNVLAERIGTRDPGNKPVPGDRVPFVYIQTNGKKLQGEKIESPKYILEKKLKIDYGYYITNQIMNPVLQIFSLVLYDMKEFKRRKPSFIQELKTHKSSLSEEKYYKKEQALKDKESEKILFEHYLRIEENKKTNTKSITSFFK